MRGRHRELVCLWRCVRKDGFFGKGVNLTDVRTICSELLHERSLLDICSHCDREVSMDGGVVKRMIFCTRLKIARDFFSGAGMQTGILNIPENLAQSKPSL